MKNLEDGKIDSLNEEEFLKTQENQENQGNNPIGEDGKEIGLGLDPTALSKFSKYVINLLSI